MKIRVKKIKGHHYIYAFDSVYIAPGKTVQKAKSLGPVRTSASLALKKKEFREYMSQAEKKLRLGYWITKIENPKFVKHGSIEKLEDLRASLYRAKKDLGEMAATAMETAFLVDFVYNSNRLEGSKIPRERVEKEITETTKKRTTGEVGNTMRALHEVENNFRFTVKKITELHGILLAHEPEKLGLRKEVVIVGNSEVTPWERVPEELAMLCKWYEEKKKTMYPPELAFDFYYKFERIHPFEDGNGRTGRLIMNHILQENKYSPMIISWKRKSAQENAFVKRMEGRAEYFYDFMKEEFVKTHEIYREKISDAIDFEKLSEIFFRPSPHYSS
jgi:Fic family protein